MHTNRWLTLATLPLTLLAACAADDAAIGDSGESEDEIVGVADFSVLEGELGFVRDQRNNDGRFTRTNARLSAGPCFKKTKGGPNPDTWKVRRYTTGAAFFRNEATGGAENTPIFCVDVDQTDPANNVVTNELGRFEIDTVIRYHLGAEKLANLVGDKLFYRFARGTVEVSNNPLQDTRDTLGRPLFRGKELLSIQITGEEVKLDPQMVALAHRVAWKTASANDFFTVASDTLGKYQGSTADGHLPIETHQFQHLHAVRNMAATGEQVFIVPRFTPLQDLDKRAVVQCDYKGGVTNFECTGL